jgi:hypothetical protein
MVSETELFHCTVVQIWRPILSFRSTVLCHCVKHQLAVVTVDIDIVGVLCKCSPSSQMPNMLICSKLTASAMIVPLLL